ncbi:MAG: extracellular solute-binding protein, partial [Spirulinaceae cyanobacterium RM2_2_10]|nr:extracellular solute-binding protein [Spirulinaceae cyanobacterium RM2_2_10]
TDWQAIAAGDVTPPPAWRRWLPFAGSAAVPAADLVTLGDAWLAEAIQTKVIAPLDLTELSHWSRLPSQWQALVRRNERGELDPDGQIWGAPYRWGTTAIAYDREKFAKLGWEPRDWADLWRPELRERIAIVNQPREVIGLTLKKLGYSYNTPDLDAIPELAAELQALHTQIRLYNTVDYLQPLILEDVWVSVGWSLDLLAAQENYPQLAIVVPRSGSAIWTDVWVRPAAATGDRRLVQSWIDFCWQTTVAKKNLALQRSRFTHPARRAA